jgi:hypothetical protein
MSGISKRGDPATRRALVNAATVLLTCSQEWNSLKAWGIRLAKRIGFSKARIAVARKLAMIMHKIWATNDRFRPKAISAEERAALKKDMNTKYMRSGPVGTDASASMSAAGMETPVKLKAGGLAAGRQMGE